MRVPVRTLPILLAFLPLASSTPVGFWGVSAQEAGAASAMRAPALVLRPGDALRLEVRDEPGLTGEYRVDDQGSALLPLLGVVRVAGRDFEEVRREVIAGFARELVRPEVRLMPLLRIAVLGEVARPGLVSVDPTYGLAELVAHAGGLTPTADRERISLIRDGRPVLTVTAESLPTVEAALRSGDQVIVGRRGWLIDNLPVFIGAGTSVVAALITALVLR